MSSLWHATGAPGTRIRAMGGRFSVDPSLAVADGYHAVSVLSDVAKKLGIKDKK